MNLLPSKIQYHNTLGAHENLNHNVLEDSEMLAVSRDCECVWNLWKEREMKGK